MALLRVLRHQLTPVRNSSGFPGDTGGNLLVALANQIVGRASANGNEAEVPGLKIFGHQPAATATSSKAAQAIAQAIADQCPPRAHGAFASANQCRTPNSLDSQSSEAPSSPNTPRPSESLQLSLPRTSESLQLSLPRPSESLPLDIGVCAQPAFARPIATPPPAAGDLVHDMVIRMQAQLKAAQASNEGDLDESPPKKSRSEKGKPTFPKRGKRSPGAEIQPTSLPLLKRPSAAPGTIPTPTNARPTQLPQGWSVAVRERMAGKSKGKTDTYYVSPTGKEFRSMVEVNRAIG